MTFIVLYRVPHDGWQLNLVTRNVKNAVKEIKTGNSNSVQIWAEEKMIREFMFTEKGEWDTEEEYKEYFEKDILLFVKYIENLNKEISNRDEYQKMPKWK